jgi:hypothetical protein
MPERDITILLTNEQALEKKNAALGDASASDVVWQAVKSFGDYSKCGV